MKKILIVILVCLMATLAYSVTTTTYHYKTVDGSESIVRKAIVTWDNAEGETFTDMNNGSVSFREIYGYFDRILIESTGTDIAYTVSLVDENLYTFFTKADCNSVTEPHGLAVFQDDTGGDPHYGVPVGGICKITTSAVTQNAELQTCTPDTPADADTFTITYSGEATAAIAYDANTVEIQTAFRLLTGCSAVTAGGVGLDDGNDLTLTWLAASGNVTPVTFDVTDTNAVDVTVVETTDGGNVLSELKVTVYYRQQPQ